MCKKLIEKELTLDTLEAWYEEHRTDFYDGNDDPDLKAQLDNIPENFKLEIDMFQDEEDKRQHETFVHNSMAMQARFSPLITPPLGAASCNRGICSKPHYCALLRRKNTDLLIAALFLQ